MKDRIQHLTSNFRHVISCINLHQVHDQKRKVSQMLALPGKNKKMNDFCEIDDSIFLIKKNKQQIRFAME